MRINTSTLFKVVALLFLLAMPKITKANTTPKYDYIAPEEVVPNPTGAGSVYADLGKPNSNYTPAVQTTYPGASKRWAEQTEQTSTPNNETANMKVTNINLNWYFVGWTKGSAWAEGSTILSTATEYTEANALPYYQVQKTSGNYADRAGNINQWANDNKDKCVFYFANFARVKASTDDVDGIALCSPLVNDDGTEVTLTATISNEDKVFVGWSLNDVLMSTDNPYTFTVSSSNYGEYKAIFQVLDFPESGTYVFKNTGTQLYASYGSDILSPTANRQQDYCVTFTIAVGDDGELTSLTSGNDDAYAYRTELTSFANEVLESIGVEDADAAAFVNAATALYVEAVAGGYKAFHQIPALTCGKSWDDITAAISELLPGSSLSANVKAFVEKALEQGVAPGGKYYLVATTDGSSIYYSTDGDTNYAIWNTDLPTENLFASYAGWGRIKNVGTSNYASFVGNEFTISTAIDFDGIAAMKSQEAAIVDPGSVFWINNHAGNSDIYSQGYGIRNGTGEWLYMTTNEDDNSALIYVSKYGYSYYLNDNGDGRLTGPQSSSSTTTHWALEPITTESMDRYYFGAKCGAKYTDGKKYYTTMYTYFPYQCMDGVKAYYVTGVEEEDGVGLVTCQEIASGKVPANTAVILECNGLDPKENRLVPLSCSYNFSTNVLTCNDKSVTAISDNMLIGTYFNLNFNQHIIREEYDPDKYLTFSIADGQLGFYRWSGSYLTPGKAYLDKTKMSESAKALRAFSLKFISDNNIQDDDDKLVSEDGGFIDGVKIVNASPIRSRVYDLAGNKVLDDASMLSTLRRGIYIVNGKKVVVK